MPDAHGRRYGGAGGTGASRPASADQVRGLTLRKQAADNGVDCAKDSGPSGCKYLDVTELIVHDSPHQPPSGLTDAY